jgi:hypothetical protein
MRGRFVPRLELLLLGAAACGRAGIADGGGPVVVAVVEVTDAAPVTSGAIAPASAGKNGGAEGCAFDVDVGDIEPSSGTCTIYEEVSKGRGRVTLPCGGADGPAVGSFGEHEYRGEVKGKRVALEHSYDFDEKDGCRWRVTGRITGTAGTAGSAGSAGALKLAWTYREEILEDDTSNCWATCTARTAMKLTPVR